MMMPDITAKDIIQPLDSYPSIYIDDNIKRALSKLQFSLCNSHLKRRSLLVLNRDDKMVGWINLWDILALIQPRKINDAEIIDLEYIKGWNLAGYSKSSSHYIRHLVWWVSDDVWPSLEKHCERIADMKITNLVRPIEAYAVQYDTCLKEVVAVMYEKNLFTLPVVEKEELIGFIRAEDIILETARIMMNLPVIKNEKYAVSVKPPVHCP
ncbi:CBS domain-containing protein [Peptococcaceae bacterium 1198_IL3148]